MRSDRRHHGFTLLELMLSAVIMAVVAAVVMPVIMSATDAYASARSLRTSVESASFAIDRIRRIIREAPPKADGAALAVYQASSTRLEFENQTGFRLNGDILEIVTPDGEAPLARKVSNLEIQYISSDGVTAAADPASAHRIHIRMTVSGVDVSTCAFPRVWMGDVP
ncbi:MAG: prepilin-type N-terminal cleavage/methylation domain-containing protein [Planctomycetota bacterium]|nr:MAG: prepilin-type N-terminal cleavage/methylation domain-containing protein [Planctomycetota bacterium]